MAKRKKILMDLLKYDVSKINDSINYFMQFGYPFYIDSTFCVYVKYDRAYHWIGYARPFDQE